MISLKFYNAKVLFPDHTMIEKYSEDLYAVCQFVREHLNKLKEKVERGLIKDPCYTTVRLENLNFLMIYVDPNHINNPYIALYNGHTKDVTEDIPFECLLKFGKEYFRMDFEEKCDNIEKKTYRKMMIQKILSQANRVARKYDKTRHDDLQYL